MSKVKLVFFVLACFVISASIFFLITGESSIADAGDYVKKETYSLIEEQNRMSYLKDIEAGIEMQKYIMELSFSILHASKPDTLNNILLSALSPENMPFIEGNFRSNIQKADGNHFILLFPFIEGE